MTKQDESEGRKSMLQTGLVYYGEVAIDLPVDEVWAVVPHYHDWSPHHEGTQWKTIAGRQGEVGEVVEIRGKEGSSKALYAETLRIRKLQPMLDGRRAANIVWKVYDEDFALCGFSDYGVREHNGGTILVASQYWQQPPDSKEFQKTRQEIIEGRDAFADSVKLINDQIRGYLEKRKTAIGHS